jgi:hypothetical protein
MSTASSIGNDHIRVHAYGIRTDFRVYSPLICLPPPHISISLPPFELIHCSKQLLVQFQINTPPSVTQGISYCNERIIMEAVGTSSNSNFKNDNVVVPVEPTELESLDTPTSGSFHNTLVESNTKTCRRVVSDESIGRYQQILGFRTRRWKRR